ncbi:MAG: sterol desaturase family protein [Acidimicrobiaceae bacterium]|nr:sterol desaturase family protein [Acidimicrobiaceae bacterium]MBP9054730.1 sterol desaturase family protein [Ilumatobacteraceae bacterium]
MLAEYAWLRKVPKRTDGDLDDADQATLSGTQLPPDPLVPVGYERKDTTASLSMLVGNVAFSFVTAAAFSRFDRLLFRHRVSNVGRRRGSFLTAMVLWDFLYYWDHRWMHEVRLLWANHVTHHSSQRYNLSTALRQPWSGFLTFWVFAPMPLLGYASKTTMRAGQLNLLYQYWIHTEAIDRLPAAAEQVLNTPSHHRVHHGANQQYLDKNYGGILIVWDRLFGTFEPEVRRIKYGLTKNIKTYNPLRIAYHEMADIARDVRSAGNMRDRLGYVLRRPGWKPVAR